MILPENAVKGTYVREDGKGVQMDVRLRRDYPRGVFTPESISWKHWEIAMERICPEGMVLTEIRVMGNMAQVTFVDRDGVQSAGADGESE